MMGAMKPTPPVDQASLLSASDLTKPRTNNVAESNNRDQKRCFNGGSLIQSIENAYMYSAHHQAEHRNRLRGVGINKRKRAALSARQRDVEDEHPRAKPPDSRVNSRGSNLKRSKLHHTPSLFKPGDRVRCPIGLFGSDYAAANKKVKFLYGVVLREKEPGVFEVSEI